MNYLKSLFVKTLVIHVIFAVLSSITYGQNIVYQKVSTDTYDLYAPSKEDIKVAKKDLNFAVAVFKKYFGEKPPKIAVGILDSPAEVTNETFRELSKGKMKFLPFLTNKYLKQATSKSRKTSLTEARVLTHESCHEYLRAYVDVKITNPKRLSTYGHPSIPDWFDEAVATLCEIPRLQENREAFLKKNLDITIDFDEFFSMEHPVSKKIGSLTNSGNSKTQVLSSEQLKELRKKLKEKSSTGGVVVTRGKGIITDKDRMFYSQALSLCKFLAKKKGNLFIEKIARGFIEGKDMKTILSKNGLVKSDYAEFEKEWKSWVKFS